MIKPRLNKIHKKQYLNNPRHTGFIGRFIAWMLQRGSERYNRLTAVEVGGRRMDPDRETWKAITTAGFDEVTIEHFRLPLLLIGPHIMGRAVKA